ncbi:MAG: bacillithiol biosynthesis deacetylase BshB1 [Pirellulales bacterium]
MLDVLVIAPHPDDAELGMGGTIALMLAQGLAVGILDLTDGEPTPLGSPEIRARETAAASAALGVTWRENLGLPNRSLRATLAARGLLAGVIRRMRPRWLFAPHWVDAHPDHVAATRLTEAARFWAKFTKCDLPGQPWHPERVYHYACVHLKSVRRPSFVIDISTTWETKRRSLACYASQFPQPTGRPGVLDRVAAADAWWGSMIGTEHGEPFWSREPVALRGFTDLF